MEEEKIVNWGDAAADDEVKVIEIETIRVPSPRAVRPSGQPSTSPRQSPRNRSSPRSNLTHVTSTRGNAPVAHKERKQKNVLCEYESKLETPLMAVTTRKKTEKFSVVRCGQILSANDVVESQKLKINSRFCQEHREAFLARRSNRRGGRRNRKKGEDRSRSDARNLTYLQQ